MDMLLSGGSILLRALSQRGFTAISHFYLMEWPSIWIEIVGGLLIAGALAAWAPHAPDRSGRLLPIRCPLE
jgi:uncharacterized protein